MLAQWYENVHFDLVLNGTYFYSIIIITIIGWISQLNVIGYSNIKLKDT